MRLKGDKPLKLLDLFCGAGGTAKGYADVGFEVVGVDIEPQPHYPYEFHQADAFEYLVEHWQEFDAIHGSPVCKGYTVMNNLPWLKNREYPLQILPLREALNAIDKPYVIENVMGARWGAVGLVKRGLEAHGMQAGWLCGTMFGLPFYRHRLFETNWFWLAPGHPTHCATIRSGDSLQARRYVRRIGPNAGKVELTHKGGVTDNIVSSSLAKWQRGVAVGIGHAAGWKQAAEAMGVPWMIRDEVTQAIPPAYTRFIGQCLLVHLERSGNHDSMS